jgi:peroxiredoxin
MALLYSQSLPLGWPAPDFKLPGTDGEDYSLSNFSNQLGLLIIFTCNHCPYAMAAWPLTIELYQQFHDQVAFVAINPNDPIAYPEDSFKQMKAKAKQWGIPFPYLHDSTQKVAKNYQAQCTPDLYLFKNEGAQFTLFYHGRINDNWQNPDSVKEKNLQDALQKLIASEDPPTDQPPSMGCSIKWKS